MVKKVAKKKVNTLKKEDKQKRSKMEKYLLIEEVEEEIEITLSNGQKTTQKVMVKKYRAMPISRRLEDVGEEERLMERATERAAEIEAGMEIED